MKPSNTTVRERMKRGMSRQEAENMPPMSKAEAARQNRDSTPWRKPNFLGGGAS